MTWDIYQDRIMAAIAAASFCLLLSIGARADIISPAVDWTDIWLNGTAVDAPSTDPFPGAPSQMVTFTEGSGRTSLTAPGMFAPSAVSAGAVMTIDMDAINTFGPYFVIAGFDDLGCGCFETSSASVYSGGGWEQFTITSVPVIDSDAAVPGFEVFGPIGSVVSFDLPVPEPTTLAVFSTALLGLGAFRRRSRVSLRPKSWR